MRQSARDTVFRIAWSRTMLGTQTGSRGSVHLGRFITRTFGGEQVCVSAITARLRFGEEWNAPDKRYVGIVFAPLLMHLPVPAS